jgi:bifunctional UDP-N-acetylglucosamine pyrophosphorylase/glucosamine-1-phosphate N-acetyltransferase
MKSDRAKVLHELLSVPMIHHVLDTVKEVGVDRTIVVVGHQRQQVAEALAGYDVSLVVQEEQLGTGHAVRCAEDELKDAAATVLILCGDVPLVRGETLRKMIDDHLEKKSTLTVMTTRLPDPTGYGRMICDDEGSCCRIVEERDATDIERKVDRINAGIYCAAVPFLFDALQAVDNKNSQGEIYLTDIVRIACDRGIRVATFEVNDPLEVQGVNSGAELAAAESELKRRQGL